MKLFIFLSCSRVRNWKEMISSKNYCPCNVSKWREWLRNFVIWRKRNKNCKINISSRLQNYLENLKFDHRFQVSLMIIWIYYFSTRPTIVKMSDKQIRLSFRVSRFAKIAPRVNIEVYSQPINLNSHSIT